MPEQPRQVFALGGKHPTGITNVLLLLILIGIIIIIFLMLFWPWWGWRGVYGADGSSLGPGGGNVIINPCCDGGGYKQPECPPPGREPPCEDICKRDYGNYPDRYKSCMEKCRPGKTCEEYCREGYANQPELFKDCLTRCNPPKTCEDKCKSDYDRCRSATTYAPNCEGARDNCMLQCNPPKTCEEACKQRYSTDTYAMSQCFNTCNPQPTCEENCRQYGTETTYYQECIRQCQPQEQQDCRDSDGNNVNVVGVVVAGDDRHTDTCYDGQHVIEWTCKDGKPFERRETCPTRCLNGACVQQSPSQTSTSQTYTAYVKG